MTYTVRIYTNAELTAYTDSDYELIEEAYATLWQNSLPLPTDGSAVSTEGHELGYAIWNNDLGVCINAWPWASIAGKTKDQTVEPV